MHYLKPSFAQIIPEIRVTLADDFRIIDAQSWELDARRSKKQSHPMVNIGNDSSLGLAV